MQHHLPIWTLFQLSCARLLLQATLLLQQLSYASACCVQLYCCMYVHLLTPVFSLHTFSFAGFLALLCRLFSSVPSLPARKPMTPMLSCAYSQLGICPLSHLLSNAYAYCLPNAHPKILTLLKYTKQVLQTSSSTIHRLPPPSLKVQAF